MRRWLSEPLLHFLLVGVGLFYLYDTLTGDVQYPSDQIIDVSEESILNFMQFRSKAFDEQAAIAGWQLLDADQRNAIITDYVREEALYREALALGMDVNDYIIKRRLIQKVEFLAQGLADATAAASEQEVQEYFQRHTDDYAVPASITFTHVYFDAAKRGATDAQASASAQLKTLNEQQVPFTQATQFGDRFPYHVNYVERTRDFVESHFGSDMTDGVFAAPVSDKEWYGPFESPLGSHLVMVTRFEPRRVPELAEIYGRVAADVGQARQRKLKQIALDEVVEKYEVRLGENIRQ